MNTKDWHKVRKVSLIDYILSLRENMFFAIILCYQYSVPAGLLTCNFSLSTNCVLCGLFLKYPNRYIPP